MKQSIQEYLGVPASWRVRERIKHEIVLAPTKHDVKTAKKKDPVGCALHNAACRVFDVPNAAIGGRWAYIPQRDPKGVMYIARMQATLATQKAIKTFDETGEMPEAGFRFIPIAQSHTYASKNKYNAQHRKRAASGKKRSVSTGNRTKRGSLQSRKMPYLANKGRV